MSCGVIALAFSPDGRRIASASWDRTVKLWDAATGQERLTLRGHTQAVSGVAFSPDGRRIASASWDRTVKLWDATPLTPELRVQREARGVVEFYFAQSLPTAEVLDRIRHDPTLSAEVRQLALELAAPYGQSLVAHEAERRVHSLYAQPLLRPEVLEHLRADSALSEPVRQQALALAKSVPEIPERLDGASRTVVRQPGAAPVAYRLALRQAEAACRLIPQAGSLLTTLGMAQYRVGEYPEAVATLTQADRINSVAPSGPIPADLAFLALAQHRLGQPDQARAALRRLQATMKRPEWATNEEARGVLREAEAIAQDLAFPADPFGAERRGLQTASRWGTARDMASCSDPSSLVPAGPGVMLNRVASELHRARGVGPLARQQARPSGCSTWSQAIENHGELCSTPIFADGKSTNTFLESSIGTCVGES